MPSFSFKEVFVPKVIDGSKPHTIRGKRKNRPRAGQTAYHYYGLRTKQVLHLFDTPITKVQDIRIRTMEMIVERKCKTIITVIIESQTLSEKQVNSLAKKDGFDSTEDFIIFFHKAGKPMEACSGVHEFIGDLIHWNPKNRL